MKMTIFIAAVIAGIAGTIPVPAAENSADRTISPVIPAAEPKNSKEWQPFRVCVLDFSSADIKGQQRLAAYQNAQIVIPPQNTLNDADRKSINSVMQGFVRMIDAWDNSMTNTSNRRAQTADNAFNRAHAIELYNTVINGESRPLVLGADYLSAYLGKHNDVFSCIDASRMTEAMNRLQREPDFPRDFMLRLAKETGATHLIYGTVSDLRAKSNSFKGYGIETMTTNYQLDVILKLVDLISQRTVYSRVYTGNYREQRPVSGTQIDHNIFQSLMTAALEQAAEDLYEKCRPGQTDGITVTPMPCRITVNPTGGMLFKPASAEICINGAFAGNGGVPLLVSPGKYRIEVKAAGYKSKSFDCNIENDAVINVTLEK